jgi:hydroxyquinol 1,2-dioxygenase
MSDYNQDLLTQEVMKAFATPQAGRLGEIMSSLVKHLHAFTREVDLKPEEWMAGLQFLTKTGQISTERRPEFILLSDVLGLSMMVVSLTQARESKSSVGATEATVEGPFYWAGAPEVDLGGNIAEGVVGEPTYYTGTVTDVTGKPLPGALMDLWSGDGDGSYDVQLSATPSMQARGKIRTDAQGQFRFWSIRPTFYPIPSDGPVGDLMRATHRSINRPGHIHMMVSAEGHVPVTTHLFVADSPYLDQDAVFGKRDSLVVAFAPHAPGTAPDGTVMTNKYYTTSYNFRLATVSA